MVSTKPIGQINGMWGVGFKLMLATYPILAAAVIAWLTWITVGQLKDESFRAAGERFSREDYRDHLQNEKDQFDMVNKRIDLLPPSDWRDRIAEIENIARDNRAALIRIETKLEGQ